MQTLINALDSQDWLTYDTHKKTLIKQFISNHNSKGLVDFWQTLLKQVASFEQYQRTLSAVADTSAFVSDIKRLLTQGTNLAKTDDSIKAFYYEYYYDGSNASTGNLFLCTRFDQDPDSDWASEFDVVLEGMCITPYFDFDPDWQMSNQTRTVACDYVHSVLLSTTLSQLPPHALSLPFAFASHDNPDNTVIILAN